MPKGIPGYLRFRVISRFDAGNSEITTDLPHLHQSTWQVVGFQPGMPSTSLVGSFRIPLWPPGSSQYKQFYSAIYSKIARYQRIEAYLGYSPSAIGLGKLVFAGVITGIRRTYDANPIYELSGETDLALADLSKPFPGELLSNDVTSAILKSYLGTNELGWADNFNPYTSGNYTSTALPGGSSGTWSGTTDDGLSVVTINTGDVGALISKTGLSSSDRWHTHYVEVTGRLVPSTHAINAGQIGIGISQASGNGNDSILGFVTAQKTALGFYQLACGIQDYSGGSVLKQQLAQTAVFNVGDPAGKIPFTLGLLLTIGGNSNGTANATLVVNGRIVLGQFQTAYDPQNLTFYPFLEFRPGSGSAATVYYTNFVHFKRFTTDGPSTAAVFGNGTISTSTNSLGYGTDPGPTFLDTWTRLANQEGWYLRYTPQAYVVGTRTLGTVDFTADPGADLTAKVIFKRRDGTLLALRLDDNGDALASGTEMTGLSSVDGGGIGVWRDITTMQNIGVLEDQTLALTNTDFNTVRAAARRAMTVKTAVDAAGHKEVEVLRAPGIADTYRELDRITIDDPAMGINMLSARIMARQFTEGSTTETLTLDHFSWHGKELAI